jgi:hypothetical protein
MKWGTLMNKAKSTLFFALSLSLNCGRKIPSLKDGFASIRVVPEYQLAKLAENDKAGFEARLVSRQEFHDSVYQNLPEAKDASIDENVYWGWIQPDRLKSVKKIFEAYGGKKLLKFEVGEAKKVIKSGPMRIHRDISVYAEFQAKDGKSIEKLNTSELFKAIVEVNGKFKLWNMNYE